MSARRTTLFVAGFGQDLRAKDLAYEFERYGRLVRCDIPAPKSSTAKVGYAFIEFEDERDAEDAYHDMHGRRVDGYQVTVQWAKNAPSTNWRYERSDNGPRGGGGGGYGGGYGGRGGDRDRRRSRSPPRRDSGRDRDDGRGGGRDAPGGGRGRSRSPGRRNDRSPSPRRSPAPRDGGRGGEASGSGADAPVEGSAGRYRDEQSPDAAAGNGADRRDDRSLSPVA